MAGDYAFYRRQYSDKTTDRNIVAADESAQHADVIAPKSAKHTVYIQKITVNITTYSAKTITFQDDAGTPVPIALISVPAAAVALPSESNSMTVDFGPKGKPLTEGKNLDIILSAAGLAGAVHIEAYEKLTGVTNYLSGASSQ